MNQVPPFELKKVRSFNEVLNDTFAFLRFHFKHIIVPFAIIMIPLALISTIPAVYYAKVLNFSKYTNSSPFNTAQDFNPLSIILIVFVVILCYALSFTSGLAIVIGYFEAWQENPAVYPERKSIFKSFGPNFLRILLSSIPMTLLIILGSIFCLVPGIWLSVLATVFYPLYVFEGGGFQFSFTRSRALLSGSFWQTFGVVIILGLIVGIIVMFFRYLAMIPVFIGAMHGNADYMLSPVIIGLTLLETLARSFLQILPFIGMVIQYFNLKEQKEGTSLADKIANLGKTPDTPDFQRPNEEF